jgi:hypothetical protein
MIRFALNVAFRQLGSCMSKRVLALAFLLIVCFIPCGARQQSSDQEIVRQARQSSYSLKSQGLIELKCAVQPDWDSMYAAVKADNVGTEQLLPIMKSTHFTVLLGPDGASTISHESDMAPPNQEVAGRVRQSVDGMEQVLTGFFQTWSSFMFNSPLPEPDDKYQLEKKGEEYDLSFGQGATQVAVVLNLDLIIEEVKLTSPQLEGTLHPEWSPSNNGLVLSGYQAIRQATRHARVNPHSYQRKWRTSRWKGSAYQVPWISQSHWLRVLFRFVLFSRTIG